MNHQVGKNLWMRLVDEQARWIETHGADLVGYIANYHERHGRTKENAVAIYAADCAELVRRQERLRQYR